MLCFAAHTKHMQDAYAKRGVSASKKEVHDAISTQDAGVFPGAFCKIVEDPCGDKNYCALMHADGAGTKASLAYIYYKETGDDSVFYDLSQDSLVMNIDDLLCVGAVKDFIVSNTIGRNAHRISGKIIKNIIDGYTDFANFLTKAGVTTILSGGETADVGDLVNTLIVDSTVFCRLKKSEVIDCDNIKAGDSIVALASFGKATYEKKYNSGIGSNGLTAARHLLFSSVYRDKYPESYASSMDKELAYCGRNLLTDKLEGTDITVGEAALSPTRTFAPVIFDILKNGTDKIDGIIHCTGGALVKSKNFGKGVKYIKNDLFDLPPLFREIRNSGQIDDKELYNVFNCGHLMEIYCDGSRVNEIIGVANKYGIEAKVIGHVEKSETNENSVEITSYKGEKIIY